MEKSYSYQHKARKRFGQNFLIDSGVIDRIIKNINPNPDDFIIEIGPGLGALTKHLFARCPSLIVIELDRDLAENLKKEYPTLNVITADALKTDFSRLLPAKKTKVKIVGNLPYNISTPLIFHLLKFKESIDEMYFMLQSEVVDRMSSLSGTKTYGRLSVMVQYSCCVDSLFKIYPHSFNPQPKINSTFLSIKPKNRQDISIDVGFFDQLVSLAFQQRRKTLKNSLQSILPQDLPNELNEVLCLRPEQLSISELIKLSNQLSIPRQT